MRRKYFSFKRLLFLALLFFGGFLMYFPQQARAESTLSVTGTLTEPDGITAISSVYVYIYKTNWSYYQGNYTDTNGVFSFYDVPAGTYNVQMYRPWGSTYYPPAVFEVEIVTGQTNDLGVIKFKDPNVSGILKNADGVAVNNLYVSAYNANWSQSYWDYTDSEGNFDFYIGTEGDYTLQINDDTSQDFFSPGNVSFSTEGDEGYDFGTITGKTPNVVGTFLNADSEVISSPYYPYALIHNNSWSISKSQSVNTTDGSFAFYVPQGTYSLNLSGGNNQPDPDAVSVTVANVDTEVDLGTIVQPTPNITVNLKRSDNVTAVSGAYFYLHNANWSTYRWGYSNSEGVWQSALTSAGSYCIDTYANLSVEANPDQYCFSFTAGTPLTINLQTQVPSMQGKIIDPDGNAVSWSSVYVYPNSSQSWVNSSWSSTDVNGVFYTNALDTGTYTVQVYPPYASNGEQLIAPDDLTISLVSGQTNTDYYTSPIQLQQPVKTIAGTVQDQDGNPVTNASISAWKNSGSGYCNTQTNSNGHYSCKVGKGKWNVSAYPQWTGSSPDWGYFGSSRLVKFEEDNSITESSTLDIEVTRYTSHIIGSVRNPDGSTPSGGDYTSVDIHNQQGFWNWSTLDSHGNFDVSVPAATVTVQIYTSNQNYTSPDFSTISVGDNTTHDMGQITLLEKKEFITCTVRDNTGTALLGQSCYAWKNKGYGWAWGNTDANGQVTLSVSRGDWVVSAYPAWNNIDVQYVNVDGSQNVTLETEQTVSVDFEFAIANSTLKGTLQDSEGNVINQYGWMEVRPSGNDSQQYYAGLGCSISAGSFECKSPAGTYDLTTWIWNADYSVTGSNTVTVEDNEVKDDIVITLLPNDATIQGHIVDSNGNTITDTSVSLFVENGSGAHMYDWVTDGIYDIAVSEGTWNLGVWVDWGSEYVLRPDQDLSVDIVAHETKDVDIVLVEEDSLVSGSVTDSDGASLQNVWVSLKTKLGNTSSNSYNDWYGTGYEWGAFTDQNGNYSITAPAGTYYVTASLPVDQNYMNPDAVLVDIDADNSGDVDFVFERPNAYVHFTVTLDGQPTEAFVYAWSEQNRYSEGSTTDGSGTLDILAPDTWYVGAIYEPDEVTYYKSPEVQINAENVDTTYEAALELNSDASNSMPEPITTTFSSSNDTTLRLSDGTAVIMPAFSITQTECNITVTATPVAEVPHQSDASPIAFAYDMTAVYADGENAGQEITSFASNVTFEIPFTDEQLEALGITTEDIVPLYWDGEAGEYRQVSNAIIADNTVLFTTSHFTYFGIMSAGVLDETVVVPQITLTSPDDNAVVSANRVVVSGTVSDAEASVEVTLNGEVVEALSSYTVNSVGTFSQVVSGLTLGENIITVQATNNVGQSPIIARTVIYQIDDSDNDDTPDDTPTGIESDIVTLPYEVGGPQVRVFSVDGDVQSSFFAFSPELRGSYQMLPSDINGDGNKEILVAAGAGFGPHIRMFTKEGEYITDFFAYNESFRGGVKMYLADVDGDDYPELITVPVSDGSAHIRIYNYNAQEEAFVFLTDFFAYNEAFRGGVMLTTADVTGDGKIDMIFTPESHGGPQVRVFEYTDSETPGAELIDQFFAYDENLRMGMKIMAADVDGNGVRDLVTAPYEGEGLGSNVRIYSFNDQDNVFELLGWTMAFGEGFRGAINIRAADLNSDDKAEIVVAPHDSGGPNVRIYGYDTVSEAVELEDWFMAYDEDFHGGVDFAITNVDGDDYAEIVTTPRHDGGPNMRIYEYDSQKHDYVLRDWILTHNEDFRGQLNVTSSDIDGNGDSELIVSPLENGGPNIRIFDWTSNELQLQSWFMAYNEAFRGGVITKTIAR